MENNKCCPTTKPADKGCSTTAGKGGCGASACVGTLIRGALIGGVVMFVYLYASWMLLPWHKTTTMSFKSDRAVAAALTANAEQSGVYLLPRVDAGAADATKMAPAKVEKPFAFVSVFNDGIDAKNMRNQLIRQFVLCLFSAMILTCLLKKAACGGCPKLFSFKVGLLVAVLHYVPNMIWYQFPVKYSLVGMADDIISITLAGVVLSMCCAKKAGSCGTEKKGSCG